MKPAPRTGLHRSMASLIRRTSSQWKPLVRPSMTRITPAPSGRTSRGAGPTRSPALLSSKARIVPLRRQTTRARTGSWRNGGPARIGDRVPPGMDPSEARGLDPRDRGDQESFRTGDRLGADRGRGQDGEVVLGREVEVVEVRRSMADPAGQRLGERRVDHEPAVGGIPPGDRSTAVPGCPRRPGARTASDRKNSEAACGQSA